MWAPNNKICEDKLKRCGLTILDRRRSRRDYDLRIEDYHWKRSSIQWERFFEWAPNTTTRDRCKINC